MSKVAPLTTRNAWLEMARWWDKPERCKCGCGRMAVAPQASGLCSSLGLMRFRGVITDRQEDEMLATLPDKGPVYVAGARPYLWPTDAGGAKERAAFCRARAGR